MTISVFAWAIYFRRHRRKDHAVVFWFFNVCVFVMVAVMQSTPVTAALGFGLFGILSVIRLRSEPFRQPGDRLLRRGPGDRPPERRGHVVHLVHDRPRRPC